MSSEELLRRAREAVSKSRPEETDRPSLEVPPGGRESDLGAASEADPGRDNKDSFSWGESESKPERIRSIADAGYRSASGRAQLVQVLLALWVVIASVAAASSLAEFRIASRLIDNPVSVSVSDIMASDDRQAALVIIWLVGYLVTGAGFIVWMLRIYDNVEPLDGMAPRHSRGWVIGGWLVPFLNLWRPKQIMDDLWVASDPDTLQVRGAEGASLGLLNAWWALWLLGAFVGGFLAWDREVSDLAELRNYAAVDVATDVIMAASAIAALLVVTWLTQRQEMRAGRRFVDYESDVTALTSGGAVAVAGALGVLSFAAFAGAFLVFDAPTVDPREAELSATSFTLSVDTDTTLTADHHGDVVIGANGVVLDCDGHTIHGTGQRVGIAVFDVDDATVTNCTIEDFEAAIVVINSQQSIVETNTISANSEGLVVVESSENLLASNSINAPDRGVKLVNTHNNEVASNETMHSAVGFELIDSTGNTFSTNRSAFSSFAGFSLTNANGNVFEANEVVSGQFAFVVTASNENILDGNSVSNGTGWFAFGFQEGSEGNMVSGNEVTGGGNAFKVYIRAARNTFSENAVEFAAKGVSIDAGCVGNVVEMNTIRNVREMGLEDASRGGSGDHGTDNLYRDNRCLGDMTPSQPPGLCEP